MPVRTLFRTGSQVWANLLSRNRRRRLRGRWAGCWLYRFGGRLSSFPAWPLCVGKCPRRFLARKLWQAVDELDAIICGVRTAAVKPHYPGYLQR